MTDYVHTAENYAQNRIALVMNEIIGCMDVAMRQEMLDRIESNIKKPMSEDLSRFQARLKKYKNLNLDLIGE